MIHHKHPKRGVNVADSIWTVTTKGEITLRVSTVLSLNTAVLAIGLCLLNSGCREEPVDVRYNTARATIETLFTAYGVHNLSELQVQERMQVRGRFHLSDPQAYQGCFLDYDGERDEGEAGYVFGRLVAAKDSLVFQASDDRVEVRSGESAEPVVLLRRGRKWSISLRDSVPMEVRRRLRGVYQRAKQRALREGHPE